MTKLIVGSPEAMQHEPSLEPPENCEAKRSRARSERIRRRLENFWDDNPELLGDVFPKGIDDSMGG